MLKVYSILDSDPQGWGGGGGEDELHITYSDRGGSVIKLTPGSGSVITDPNPYDSFEDLETFFKSWLLKKKMDR